MIIGGEEMSEDDIFEYTLEDVLNRRYGTVYSNKYYVNWDYILKHIGELIILRDVVVPSFHISDTKVRKIIAFRRAEDWETYGIYRWEEMYSRDLPQSIDEMREDEVRLALDIAKKYPEHSEIVGVREVEMNYTNFPNDQRNFDSAEQKINLVIEKMKPIEDMIDDVYSNLINDELINLDDYVPSEFLSDYARDKREDRLLQEGVSWLYELEGNQLGKILSSDNLDKAILKIMFEMDDFIKKYPQYSKLIPDYDAFVRYGDKLCEKVP